MKKLFLTLLLSLFLAFNAWAISPAFLDLISSGGVTCDDCSGSLKFAWHMEDNDDTPDVTLGNPCGCSDGDTIGAKFGSPVFSTTQKSDGACSLHIDALDKSYAFDVSAYDIAKPGDIKMTFDIHIVSYPGATAHHFFRTHYDSANLLVGYIKGGKVYIDHKGFGTVDGVSVTVATGSWVSCEYQGKTGIAGNDHYLICGGNSVEDDDDLMVFASSPTVINFGDVEGNDPGEYYFDNMKIDSCDRY